MKFLAMTLALAGLASTATLNAQIVSNSRVTGNVNSNRNNGCAYNRTTNSVGDIIFGRASANTCEDVYSRDDGAWYQIGQGGNNNSIYERRTADARGNLVIQRGRRNPNGTFTILSTRVASTNDKQWKRAQRQQQKDWKKSQKEQQKEQQKERQKQGKSDNNQNNHDNHR